MFALPAEKKWQIYCSKKMVWNHIFVHHGQLHVKRSAHLKQSVVLLHDCLHFQKWQDAFKQKKSSVLEVNGRETMDSIGEQGGFEL